MFLFLKLIWLCCLQPAPPALDTAHPVISITFTPDRRQEDPAADTLFYHTYRKLRWDDFKAAPPLRPKSGAVSYTSFAYEGGSLQKKDTLFIRLTLQVFFIKSASWVTAPVRASYGLAHEQLHFDITWLVALRFQQKIRKMPLNTADYDSIIQYEYIEAFREMNHLQDAYDEETSHGQNTAAQAKWQHKVAEMIFALTLDDAITAPYLLP